MLGTSADEYGFRMDALINRGSDILFYKYDDCCSSPVFQFSFQLVVTILLPNSAKFTDKGIGRPRGGFLVRSKGLCQGQYYLENGAIYFDAVDV